MGHIKWGNCGIAQRSRERAAAPQAHPVPASGERTVKALLSPTSWRLKPRRSSRSPLRSTSQSARSSAKAYNGRKGTNANKKSAVITCRRPITTATQKPCAPPTRTNKTACSLAFVRYIGRAISSFRNNIARASLRLKIGSADVLANNADAHYLNARQKAKQRNRARPAGNSFSSKKKKLSPISQR